jgi:hypothetical protein
MHYLLMAAVFAALIQWALPWFCTLSDASAFCIETTTKILRFGRHAYGNVADPEKGSGKGIEIPIQRKSKCIVTLVI